jgi:hypothetical protein
MSKRQVHEPIGGPLDDLLGFLVSNTGSLPEAVRTAGCRRRITSRIGIGLLQASAPNDATVRIG